MKAFPIYIHCVSCYINSLEHWITIDPFYFQIIRFRLTVVSELLNWSDLDSIPNLSFLFLFLVLIQETRTHERPQPWERSALSYSKNSLGYEEAA